MIITYKKATHEDIKKIRAIAEKTWFVTYEPILGKEQPQFMFDLIYSEVALAEQMIDGQVFVLQFADNQIVQGGGFGKKLLIEVESQLKDLGGKILDLNVNRYNKARFFYEKVGFEIILEEDIPIGDYWMNDFVMRKTLS